MKSFVLFTLVSFPLVACAPNQVPMQPTVIASTTSSPLPIILVATASYTPSPTPIPTTTYTVSPEPNIAPNCRIRDEDGRLYLLSDQEFRSLFTTDGMLDRVLATHYPEWANYRQAVAWSTEPVRLGEIIVAASLDEEANLQINPAVTLVTLGENLDWQLPSNTDLYAKAQELSTTLNRLSLDWDRPQNESLRNQYPQTANTGTYAFYIFFDHKLDRLQSWCNTYQLLFGTPQ